MSITFAKAVKGKNCAFIGLAGPSGSGKTLSALRIAKGLGGKVAVIDTENKRALHYAENFDFLHCDFQPPYTPARYTEHVDAAIKAGADVIIVDSGSHEWEGPGGILEMQVAEFAAMGNRDAMKFTSWIKPKGENNKFVNHLLQINKHVIMCFRAKEGMLLEKNDKGKIEPKKIGWVPIAADRLEYDLTCMLILPPGSKGGPDLSMPATKMPFYLKSKFTNEDGSTRQITEETGKAIAEWAGSTPAAGSNTTKIVDKPEVRQPAADATLSGEALERSIEEEGPQSTGNGSPEPEELEPPIPTPKGVDKAVWRQACAFAEDGRDALTKFINTITAEEWKALQPNMTPLRDLFPKVSA